MAGHGLLSPFTGPRESSDLVQGDMTRITKELDAWPESTEEMLSLIESFDRLQKKHAREFSLSLSIFSVPTTQAEIDAVLKAGDKPAAAAALHARKLDSWS